MKIAITGGRIRKNSNLINSWNIFESCVLIIYDTITKEVVDRLEYITPIEHKPNKGSSVLFKAASLFGNNLLLTTKTEVLTYSITDKKIISCLSNPLMNDVHHAASINDRLYVVSTGIDSILEFKDGELMDIHYLSEGSFSDKFDSEVDFRKIEDTKPHQVHPNYIFEFKDNIYVSRFNQKDVINLSSRETFSIADNYIHDGVVINGLLYFTIVDGRVVVTDLDKLKKTIDLDQMENSEVPLGWCRSIVNVSDGVIGVGYSVLRNTKIKENVKWVYSKLNKNHMYTNKRTRISFYDLREHKMLNCIYLDELGLDAVFSIIDIGQIDCLN